METMEDKTEKLDTSGIDAPADGVPQADAAETAAMEPVEAAATDEQAGTEAPAEPTAEDEGTDDPEAAAKHKQRNIIIGVAVVLLALVLGIGGCIAVQSGSQGQEDEPDAAAVAEKEEKAVAQEVILAYEAEGRQEGASPIIAHIEGETEDDQQIDFYHAMSASEDTVKLLPGSYTVSFIGAINPDGSIVVPKGDSQKLTFTKDEKPSTVKVAYDTVAKDDVDEGQIGGILDQINNAIKKGDSTLTGDAGKKVVDTAAENAKANEKADTDKVDEAKKEAEESADSGSEATNTGGGQQQATSHTHTPVAQTEQRWVSNPVQVYVEDQPGYYENIPTGSYIKCDHGYTFQTDEAYEQHLYSILDSGGRGCGESVHLIYEDVWHDAVGHYETQDQGHYETVTTGYKCSTCGATL